MNSTQHRSRNSVLIDFFNFAILCFLLKFTNDKEFVDALNGSHIGVPIRSRTSTREFCLMCVCCVVSVTKTCQLPRMSILLSKPLAGTRFYSTSVQRLVYSPHVQQFNWARQKCMCHNCSQKHSSSLNHHQYTCNLKYKQLTFCTMSVKDSSLTQPWFFQTSSQN